MSGHIPRSLPLQGAVPLEARKFWARLQKGRDHAGFCLWSVGLPSRADLVAKWACCSPGFHEVAGPKRAWASTSLLPPSLCQSARLPGPLQW